MSISYCVTKLDINDKTVIVEYITQDYQEAGIKLLEIMATYNTSINDKPLFTINMIMPERVEVYEKNGGMLYGYKKNLRYIYEIIEYVN